MSPSSDVGAYTLPIEPLACAGAGAEPLPQAVPLPEQLPPEPPSPPVPWPESFWSPPDQLPLQLPDQLPSPSPPDQLPDQYPET